MDDEVTLSVIVVVCWIPPPLPVTVMGCHHRRYCCSGVMLHRGLSVNSY